MHKELSENEAKNAQASSLHLEFDVNLIYLVFWRSRVGREVFVQIHKEGFRVPNFLLQKVNLIYSQAAL